MWTVDSQKTARHAAHRERTFEDFDASKVDPWKADQTMDILQARRITDSKNEATDPCGYIASNRAI
jgi:hypothetical protein